MKSFRDTLRGPAGTAIAIGILAVGGIALYIMLFGGGPSASDSAGHRTFVDAESGKPFTVTISPGMTMPAKSPFTGNATGYEPELCYWTPEGTAKATPDYVLLNARRIPPIKGPTFCPVCHRLVVGHNPAPTRGDAAPPTEQQYLSKSR